MNILILSGRFGLGHRMAANAIGEQYRELNKDAKITHLDLLAYCYPHCSRFLFWAFQKFVEHCSGIYNLVYILSGKFRVDIKPAGYSVFQKLQKLLEEYKPDVIVCTLPLCAKSIASYIDKTGCKIPLVTCVTDISIHPEWFVPQTQYYLAPTKEVKDNLVREGAFPEQIFVTGIPVRQQFLHIENNRSREPGTKEKRVLIMGGGLGIIPDLGRLVRTLHELPGVYTTVIAGNNQKVYDTWNGCYEDVEVLGFTESISDYMKEADLVITKVGGITLFEAIQCEVPLFVIHPFLKQEINNAKYAQKAGIAEVVWNRTEDYMPVLRMVLTEEEKLQCMKMNIRFSKDHICDMELADAMKIMMERMSA